MRTAALSTSANSAAAEITGVALCRVQAIGPIGQSNLLKRLSLLRCMECRWEGYPGYFLSGDSHDQVLDRQIGGHADDDGCSVGQE